MLFTDIKNGLLRFLFPIDCPFCHQPLFSLYPGYCENCRQRFWRLDKNTCSICGQLFSYDNSPNPICADCRGHRFPYTAITAPLSYNPTTVRNAVLSFKNRRQWGYFRPFGVLMADAIRLRFSKISFDAIVYVPTELVRLKKRDFCPPQLLAEELSRQLALPVLSVLKKTRKTPKQSSLALQERRSNLKDAFCCTDPTAIDGKILLLVDDVCTTGASLKECAKALRRAGAKKVYCITLARTEKNRGVLYR